MRPIRCSSAPSRPLVQAAVTAATAATLVLTSFAGGAAAAPKADDGAAPVGDWASLTAAADRDGTVPVVVAFDTPARLPHTLTPAQHRDQSAAVGKARSALRAELPSRAEKALKTMADLPVLAFHATADDLDALRTSKRVVEVLRDEERRLPDVVGLGEGAQDVTPSTRPSPPAPAETGAPAGTTSNGYANALPQWWDYYRVGVDKSAGAGYTGAGQTVAVLDTGVDRYHSWLQGDVVNEACFATSTVGTGACPNGGRYQYGLGAAKPCTQAACAHGTHVAHTAAGRYGVAPGAQVIAVQVFHPTSDGPRVFDSDLTWGLKHVYDLRGSYRIAAANLSLGGGRYAGFCDSSFASTSDAGKVGGWINALTSVGIAAVVSSGNDNYSDAVGKPACFSAAVSVGNTTLTGASADAVFGNASYYQNGVLRWTGSNSNATLNLLAPGTDICSAVPGNGVDCGYIGTSMAAPHVAGAFAVLRQYRPAATVSQVTTALHRSGTSVYDGRNGITRSRINVWSALGTIWSV